MKLNWKVLVLLIVLIGAIVRVADSTRSTSYSGTDLNFEVGNGTVTMTNPSNEPIPVRLLGTSRLSFAASIDGISHTSTREGGSGSSSTAVYEFELPPGISEFTVLRGSEVRFVADTNTNLKATVHATHMTTKIGVLVVLLFAALFCLSYIAGHRWLYSLLGQKPSSKLHSKPYTGEEEPELRAYGDNRGKKVNKSHLNP